MLKQLIFGKNKSEDYLFGVWIGLILGSMIGISFLCGNNIILYSSVILIVVGLCFGGFGRFIVGGDSWFDGGYGFSRGVIISISLAAAFITFFKYNNLQWYVHVLLILTIMEIIFWIFDKAKPKKGINTITFAGKRKLVCLLDSVIIYIGSIGIGLASFKIYPYLKQIFPEILKWVGYIGVALLVLAVFVLFIYLVLYLNSNKYRGKRKK